LEEGDSEEMVLQIGKFTSLYHLVDAKILYRRRWRGKTKRVIEIPNHYWGETLKKLWGEHFEVKYPKK